MGSLYVMQVKQDVYTRNIFPIGVYQTRKHFKEYMNVYERLIASRDEVHTLVNRLIEILDLKRSSMMKGILKTVLEE